MYINYVNFFILYQALIEVKIYYKYILIFIMIMEMHEIYNVKKNYIMVNQRYIMKYFYTFCYYYFKKIKDRLKDGEGFGFLYQLFFINSIFIYL